MAGFPDYMAAIAGPVLQGSMGVITNNRQASLMRENQAWQEKMMHYQNQYNSPTQQRLRAIAAGIAPNFSPQGAAGVESVTTPHLNTPDFSGVAGIPAQLRNADLTDEQIEQTRMKTYRDGIDSSVYLQQKMIELSEKLEDLRKKGIDNDTARVQYNDALKRFNLLEDTYDALVEKEFSEVENINQRTKASEAEVDIAYKQFDLAVRDFNELVRHHKVSEALTSFANKTDRMDAITNRMNATSYGRIVQSQMKLNEQQAKHVEQLTQTEWFRTYVSKHTASDAIETARFQRKIAQYSAEERLAAARVAAIEQGWTEQRDASALGSLLRISFGLSPDEVASAVFMIGLGTGMASRARSAAAKVPESKVAPFNPPEKGISLESAEQGLGRPLNNVRNILGK